MSHHPRPTTRFLLRNVVEQAQEFRKTGQSFAAVFDLDSTLFRVEPRILQILKEFAHLDEWKAQHPDITDMILQLRALPKAYHFRDFLSHLGLGTAPEAFRKAAFRFWLEKFFHSDYLHLDVPYEGARDFVAELHKANAEIIYLTGRDEPRMAKGTLHSLRNHGFPTDSSSIQLLLKPRQDLDDGHFKRDEMRKIASRFSKVWFFENEPVNIHLIHEAFPEVEIVYFDSVHSGVAEPPGPHIHRIESFLDPE